MTNDELVNPDMPSEQIKLHMGEMSAAEVRSVRAAISWANSKAANRIRELEAELEAITSGPGSIIGPIEKSPPVTHVIVPVKPTEAMVGAGRVSVSFGPHPKTSFNEARDIYRAMIKAAQEKADDQ